jgi:uncharacterized protein (TIGR03437 family)
MNTWINLARRIAFAAVVAAFPSLAQTPPTDLQVDVSDFVLYNYDTFDTSQFGMNPNATSVMMKTYNFHIAAGDIIAVGGVPAKGTLLCSSMPMFVLNPTPAPRTQAIADTSRSMIDACSLEIMTGSGVAVGTIYYSGLFAGPPPPGKPAASTRSNMIVTGGTGAFLGARGQAGHISWAPRVASVTEDPANRRVNGGGAQSIILQLFPMFRPEILTVTGGPAIVHASNFELVTAANPARGGEILTLYATGLGPTTPAVPLGQPFPEAPLHLVNAPVDVTINGQPGEVLYSGGYPGAVDTYQVNFRAPSGIAAGTAVLRLTAAWISGFEVTIFIR